MTAVPGTVLMTTYRVTPTTANDLPSGELAMMLLNESLALERMSDRRQRAVADERRRQLAVARRVASARRLQRRAESASRRARALMLSL
jgi:hypothetical protein